MPTPAAPFTLPPDAFEKSAAKAAGLDHYADLSDEEREEEGLPAREKPKPTEAPPAEKPEPAVEPAAEPTDDDEDEGPELSPDQQALFDEIASLREDLTNAMGNREPAADPKRPKEDPLLAAARDHDDPVVKGLAERLERAEKELEEQRSENRKTRVAEQRKVDNAEWDDVAATYQVDGKPITQRQLDAVEDWMLDAKNREVARRLSIEDCVRIVHKTSTKVGKASSPAPPKKTKAEQAAEGAPTATIVDEAAGGGAPTGAEPFKPRKNESIESAVAEFGRRNGWRR